MKVPELSILGSCVSRDAFVLCEKLPNIRYIARQTIACLPRRGSTSDAPAGAGGNLALTVSKDASPFIRRLLEHDINKDVFEHLNPAVPLIVDLVDERFRIRRLGQELYTYSNSAVQFSNMRALPGEFIPVLGQERRRLTLAALPFYIARLSSFHTVILHKVFFEEDWPREKFDSAGFNIWLAELYGLLEKRLPNLKVIEVPAHLRKISRNHKWGEAPMHFIDEYYIHFLSSLGDILQWDLKISPEKSLQKPINEN